MVGMLVAENISGIFCMYFVYRWYIGQYIGSIFYIYFLYWWYILEKIVAPAQLDCTSDEMGRIRDSNRFSM